MTSTQPRLVTNTIVDRIYKRHSDVLSRSLDYLAPRGEQYLDQHVMSALSISLLPLGWHDSAKNDSEPRFSEPLSVDYMNELYPRTGDVDYQPEWLDDWTTRGYHTLDDSGDAFVGKLVTNHLQYKIGHMENPVHIASELDWLVYYHCAIPKTFRNLVEDPFWPDVQDFYLNAVLRAVPWPQDPSPTHQKRLRPLRERIESKSGADMAALNDQKFRRPGKKESIHLGVVIVENMEPREDRLSRNEIGVAVAAIQDQLRQRINRQNYLIFPVFVYAFTRKYVRMLQVHLDPLTLKLIVRKTSYIHISRPEREDEIKLLLRWMLARPIGRTRFDELDTTMDTLEPLDTKQRKDTVKCMREEHSRRVSRLRNPSGALPKPWDAYAPYGDYRKRHI